MSRAIHILPQHAFKVWIKKNFTLYNELSFFFHALFLSSPFFVPHPSVCTDCCSTFFNLPQSVQNLQQKQLTFDECLIPFNSQCIFLPLRIFRSKEIKARRRGKLQERKLVPVHVMKAYRGVKRYSSTHS